MAVMGKHMVNLKCLTPTMSSADVFYATRIAWAVLPFLVSTCCMFVWVVLSRFREVKLLKSKMKASVVALLFLLWPGICSETVAIFSCRYVCGKSLLRIDFGELCWEGRHRGFVMYLGAPMLILYVISLPAVAIVNVWRLQNRATDRDMRIEQLKGHMTWGLFYSAFDPRVWWWESTVAARKLMVAFIGTFGESLGVMQVHMTAWMMVVNIVMTACVQPFGNHRLLQFLEMGTLLSTWMMLWAGSVFNDHPRCEDGKGGTLVWCDALSIFVGILAASMAAGGAILVVYFQMQEKGKACCQLPKQEESMLMRITSLWRIGPHGARSTSCNKSRRSTQHLNNPTVGMSVQNEGGQDQDSGAIQSELTSLGDSTIVTETEARKMESMVVGLEETRKEALVESSGNEGPWKRFYDAASGYWYQHNEITGESRWENE